MTEEQRLILQKAEESLRGAKVMLEAGFHDFAAGRAFYAMFYIVEAFLVGDNLMFSKQSAVISAFGERFASKGRIPAKFHRYVIDAQEDRNIGDYQFDRHVPAQRASFQITRAEEFLKYALENLK